VIETHIAKSLFPTREHIANIKSRKGVGNGDNRRIVSSWDRGGADQHRDVVAQSERSQIRMGDDPTSSSNDEVGPSPVQAVSFGVPVAG
jgi:hypothetical protein